MDLPPGSGPRPPSESVEPLGSTPGHLRSSATDDQVTHQAPAGANIPPGRKRADQASIVGARSWPQPVAPVASSARHADGGAVSAASTWDDDPTDFAGRA